MQLFIFKTNIKSREKVISISSLFENMNSVFDWNIDLQDIDNVLRIEASETINEADLIHLVRTKGFYCETLND